MQRALWLVAAVLVLLALLVFVYLFACGSFEEFPTPEKIEGNRLTYGAIIALLAPIEVFFVTKVFKKQ